MFLVFQIYGTIGSFGDMAVGGNRHTKLHPTRSMIIGLLGNAMGYNKNETDKLNELNKFKIGVKSFENGNVLTDYHTIQTPIESSIKRLKKRASVRTRKEFLEASTRTVVSKREYCQDFYHQIALFGDNLNIIKESLLFPNRVLYIGRKNSPLCCYLRPEIINAGYGDTAFHMYGIETGQPDLDMYLGYQKASFFWDEGFPMSLEKQGVNIVYDYPVSWERRQFVSRNEVFNREDILNVL